MPGNKKMTSMALSKKESGDRSVPDSILGGKDKGPQFPFGLSINLDNDSLKKLGMDMPDIGDKKVMVAKIEVTSVSARKQKGESDHKHVELQITHMAIENAPNSAEEKLFG